MSGPKCAFNTAAALRRVFIPSNLGTSEYLHVTRIFVPALLASSFYQARAASWTSPAPPKPSSYNGQPPKSNFRISRGPPVRRMEQPKRVKVKLARLPRDDEIRDQYVHVVEDTDSYGQPVLSDPRRTKNLLEELDLKTYSLQVIEPSNMPKEDLEQLEWPVCRIVNKREELEKARKEKDKKKASAIKEKTLELNWALAPHDQDHKLRTMQKFLNKGYRVQVVLMRKQNGKAKATTKDAQALVDRVVESAKEVTGSVEWKKREGDLLATMKINFQGKLLEKVEDKEEKDAE